MAEVVIIDRVEDDDYQGKAFKKVTDKTGKTFNVKYGREGALKAKWPLLVPGTAIEITWGEYNGKPFVQDFAVVAEASKVAKLEPRKPAELGREEYPDGVNDGRTPLNDDLKSAETPPPNPQAVGMMTKELGDMIRSSSLVKVFGVKIAVELVSWYRSQTFGITRINYDGKDLPVFK